jgi:hypothetical protein
MAKGVGVHGSVRNDCVTCHVDHAGVEGELRPFDQRQFDHARVTGFPLDGRHVGLPGDCAACHKERSFLTLSSGCASCHSDVHKGSLGRTCTSCHATRASFKDLGGVFDHAKSAFPLRGAHRTAACTGCHADQRFKGVAFASCTSCHTDPHRQAMGASCTSCHTEASWQTQKIDHSRTAFPLKGLHREVKCELCHVQPSARVKPTSATCGSCHLDVHRGAFPQDCGSCHTESGFKNAPFDHATTAFVLTGAHVRLACAVCHKPTAAPVAGLPTRRQPGIPARPVADFRGLRSACVSCHADVHEGELGTSCQTCHQADTFVVENYRHSRFPEFFAGQHAALTCSQCHVPAPITRPIRTSASLPNVRFTTATTTCATCHQDVHLGQEGSDCQTCHTVQTAKFAIASFEHTKTGFDLTGRHATLECALCHKVETGVFPAGEGTAVRLKGVGRECRACHVDVHLGQLNLQCETCHQSTTFHLAEYRHRRRAADDFFRGKHVTASCQSCHKAVTAEFPAGRGLAIQFQAAKDCVTCHNDKHRGSLGPRCGDCHRP